MKNYLLLTCFLIVFACFNGIADNTVISFFNETLQTETQPQQSGSSVIGGIIILVSIAIGYGTRKIYEIRSRNREELH